MTPVQEIMKVDESQALTLLAKVDGLLDFARSGREQLLQTYVEIGLALDEVEKQKAWMCGFRSFEAYLKEHCEPRFGKSRTQLFGAKSVARNLLPSVPREQLIEMGISRAMSLAAYVKTTGKPAHDLLPAALDPKVSAEEFQSIVGEATHLSKEPGKWHQISVRASDDEWDEIKRAMKSALLHYGPISPETSDPTKNKIALQRMSQEWISTYPDNGEM